MERDFRQELKRSQQSEIPDLWNRIEAGLPEKKKNAAYSLPWHKWAPVAAACLCLAVVFPVLVMQNGKRSGKMSDSAGVPEMANEMAVQEGSAMSGAMQDGAEADGAMQEEAAADEAVQGGGLTAPDAADRPDGMEEAGAPDTAGNKKASDSVDLPAGQTESASSADSIQESAGEEVRLEKDGSFDGLADGQLLQGMTVQILETGTSEGENFYRALIIRADEEALLAEGAEIEMTDDAGTQYELLTGPREEERLKEGGRYEVSLRYEADGHTDSGPSQQTGRFVLVTAAN